MNTLTYILVTFLTFCFMEFMAWFTHKYIMHGFLWTLHEDHHIQKPGFFERNDFFFLIFAIPSFLFFYYGSLNGYDWRFYIGLGVLLYGICYFLVHDVFIHRRFDWLKQSNNTYLRGIRKAHKVHHKYLSKEKGECFGMLLVPIKFWLEAKKAKSI